MESGEVVQLCHASGFIQRAGIPEQAETGKQVTDGEVPGHHQVPRSVVYQGLKAR